ncbi:MAG: Thymidylate kinase [Piccolia ochrophora]|nr:MAG: Thymidylate kinase [Piccolia ochrophora]
MLVEDEKAARGLFVVVEGLDRAGKSSQTTRLVRNLELDGKKVRHMKFPGANAIALPNEDDRLNPNPAERSTAIGKIIDAYLQGRLQQEDHVIHLLFSANRWEFAQQIRDELSAGTVVVIDRYYYSGCVYSAAKGIPGLSLDWAHGPEVGLPRPDVCLFLDIAADEASRRGGFGDERYEVYQMQHRVRELFDEFRRISNKDDICIIDANRPESEVEKSIWRVIQHCMQQMVTTADYKEVREVRPQKFNDQVEAERGASTGEAP